MTTKPEAAVVCDHDWKLCTDDNGAPEPWLMQTWTYYECRKCGEQKEVEDIHAID